jgi:hypothetical protein
MKVSAIFELVFWYLMSAVMLIALGWTGSLLYGGNSVIKFDDLFLIITATEVATAMWIYKTATLTVAPVDTKTDTLVTGSLLTAFVIATAVYLVKYELFYGKPHIFTPLKNLIF